MTNDDHHRPSQPQKSSIDTLTAEESNCVIADANANLETQRMALIVQILLRTGMHVEEVMNLKVTDIDLDTAKIRVSADRSSCLRGVPLLLGSERVSSHSLRAAPGLRIRDGRRLTSGLGGARS